MRIFPHLATWLIGGAAASIGTVLADVRFTLTPANVDRAGQVISLQLPADAPKSPELRDANGHTLALQVDADRTARFILAWQAAGTAPTFTLIPGRMPKGAQAVAGVSVKPTEGNLSIAVNGQPALGYHMDKEDLPRSDIKPEYKRAGYLHPVLSPAGKLVSDDYPVQHIHHHGIWSPWTKTKFQGRAPDFWNMGTKTGTVEFVALDRTWSGPVHGGFAARHRMVDLSAPTPVAALNETWVMTAYDVAGAVVPVRMFDLEITQTCATQDPLILPEYHYGGLGYRGRTEWFGEKNSNFLTSEGETDRVKANANRARWINQHGAVEGGVAGLTILGHPGNFRAPQPLRVHPKEPYFCFTPSQAGEWRIEPGKPYVARYRFVVADGAPERTLLDAYWQGYAQPASAKFNKP